MDEHGISTVARTLAQRALAKREAAYEDEVRRLLDAALTLMRERGPDKAPRVADIVAAAGLSNDAFYRHFPSKADLTAALIEDGAQKLHSYAAHQVGKGTGPADQVGRWVSAVLSQAEGEVAAQTRAVLWNRPDAGRGTQSRQSALGALSDLLLEPFTALGSRDPRLHSRLAAHATLGVLADHLQQQTEATVEERETLTAAWIAMASG